MSTALYRRYRPETFAEVIGQEHVTVPLCAALAKDRVNHAYLFSGPRGCGKTTSARILARCLNCAQGATSTPCGTCPSCVDLARGGPGSLDVVEIDAASHGGVDDARSLRERAAFAPARDRYKVFIIDEAHMVSTQGFNALLKIVEEPPPHVRFVFATTEPEKVIGTIRSRTHHYPFRLVPPERLQAYLGEICKDEGVPVDHGVLELVVRAGAGSVRDSLSVLDQLIAGAGDEGLTYSLAVSVLGYTDAALLDEVADGLAAGDGRAVFGVLDRVISSGHDPRRFVEDLLERLRDLLVVAAVPDGGHAVLRGLPADQLERMRGQAARFGRAELSRAADVVNTAFTEMTGATSPRLQLELLGARLLLPGSDDTERGLRARVDRIEKRIGVAAPGAPLATPAGAPRHTTGTAGASGAGRPAVPSSPSPSPSPSPQPPPPPSPFSQSPSPQSPPPPPPSPSSQSPSPRQPGAAAEPSGATRPALPASVGGVDTVRRMWSDVLNTLRGLRRMTWTLVSEYAQVLDLDGGRLLLLFDSPGRAASFSKGSHAEYVRRSLIEVIGLDCRVEAVSGDPAQVRARARAQARPVASGPGPAPVNPRLNENAAGRRPPGTHLGHGGSPPGSEVEPPGWGTRARPGSVGSAPGRRPPGTQPGHRGLPAGSDDDIPLPPEPPAEEPPPEDDFNPYARPSGPQPPAVEPPAVTSPAIQAPVAQAPVAQAPVAQAPARTSRYAALRAAVPARGPADRGPIVSPDDEPSVDDPTIEESGLVGPSVVAQLLGGRVIEERQE